MRGGKSLSVASVDIRGLKGLVQDRNAPQNHIWRAEIVLLTVDGVGTNEIVRRTAKSKTCVSRWQESPYKSASGAFGIICKIAVLSRARLGIHRGNPDTA